MKYVESQLIHNLLNGDECAFNTIYKRYFKRLHHFAFRYLNHTELADEVTQDVFIKLWRRRTQLRCQTEVSLLSWLFTVLKYNCYHELQQIQLDRSRYAPIDEVETSLNLMALEQLDTSETNYSELYLVMLKAVDKLPPQCKLVFVKSRFEGCANKEISKQLGISVKAVEANITRANKELITLLQECTPLLIIFIY